MLQERISELFAYLWLVGVGFDSTHLASGCTEAPREGLSRGIAECVACGVHFCDVWLKVLGMGLFQKRDVKCEMDYKQNARIDRGVDY